ncbi:MAG: hypothetical protein IT289_01600 [Oligoflexia bacterium]|nr:hypothetical protein [Oligoflexia bacterium]
MRIIFICALLASGHLYADDCVKSFFRMSNLQNDSYEATRTIGLKPTKQIKKFQPQTGIRVTKRNSNGAPIEIRLRVLSDNPQNQIGVIGDFNQWDSNRIVWLKPEPNSPYFSATLVGWRSGDQYRLVLNGEQVLDPSAAVYSSKPFNSKSGREGEFLNSIFWDLDQIASNRYFKKIPDLRGRPVVATEIEIFELVRHWPKEGRFGPASVEHTYEFIRTSGVIAEIKKMGINAIEFLPFNASDDGSRWDKRYLVYGLFSIESRYGSPQEFAEMVKAFNEAGISVVMDMVASHYPHWGNEGVRNIEPIGLHRWIKADGRKLFGEDPSPWKTLRYDYANRFVRRYLIDAALLMIKNYGIGGIRLDNYDGIKSAPGGEQFLLELMTEIRAYAPQIWANSEMFFGDNRVTRRMDQGGFGMDVRSHSDFFDFIKEFAQKPTEEIDMEILRRALRDPWAWQEAARLFYLTNHDEASNDRGGATGRYFASLVDGGDPFFVEGKTRAFAALALLAGSYFLDMPQLRLMQKGSFNTNPGVQWENRNDPRVKSLQTLFTQLIELFVNNPAFTFSNQDLNIEHWIDYENKVIVLKRQETDRSEGFFIVINLGHRELKNWQFGANSTAVLLELSSHSTKIKSLGDRIELDHLAPYGVYVIKAAWIEPVPNSK